MPPYLSRFPSFYHGYISQVTENDLKAAFQNHTKRFVDFLATIPEEKVNYAYAEGKWTIKEVLQHIIDTERIFCYRALTFARKDETPLPGFDEDVYAKNSKASQRNWKEMIEEFKAVRLATELLFQSFDDEQLDASGVANSHSNYVLGIGYIIAGHCTHHINIIRERYLNKQPA
ncbi:MAG: DNA damage-inducible protein DinB [Chitinophagaceae bacterium]